jgi:hypothetical protein
LQFGEVAVSDKRGLRRRSSYRSLRAADIEEMEMKQARRVANLRMSLVLPLLFTRFCLLDFVLQAEAAEVRGCSLFNTVTSNIADPISRAATCDRSRYPSL